MQYAPEYINKIRNGFQGDSVEKVLRLQTLLSDFSKHPYLKDRIVLKGGTAITQFHFQFPRISVDIDLDYIGSPKLEGMKEERPRLEETMDQIFKSQKYVFEWSEDEHAGRKCMLKFVNFHGNNDNVRVDINYLMRIPVMQIVRMKSFSFEEDFHLEFPVLQLEELYAGKTKALLERGLARDLYDLYRLLKDKLPIDTNMWRTITILFCSSLRDDFRKYTSKRLDIVSETDVWTALHPILRSDERPTREEMMKIIYPFIEELFSFKENEKQYLDSLMKGVYDPSLLFGKGALAEKLAKHPALLWKAKNVSEYLTKQ
ncbi:hypothetical protein AUJ66_05335 [Candidatus Desantisbacteria bacterium CG1_02_38_46]|nr:MAG: hypothetical protein AUJ66_05335 [Candidatus Desantisbacteria bacterium CG1_02_38_46]